MKSTQLKELARLYNIQITYEDAAGKTRHASRDALMAILRTRTDVADLLRALADRKHALRTRFIEPVTVVWGRSKPRVALRLPQSESDRRLEWSLQLEDGSTRSGAIDLSAVRAEWSEEDFVGKTVTVGSALPFGYHVLRVGEHETFVIAAPVKAHALQGKSWGVFAPLYSIRTGRSWGAGDLGDMHRYREWVNDLGGGVVATLPLLAIDTEGDPSPYSPLSRLYWNEMYLDVERLPEFDPSERDANALAALQNTDRVDYPAVMREKRRVLKQMAARFRPDENFAAFAEKTRDYARFRAAHEFRDSDDYHLYVQYRMSQQMREVADDAKRHGAGLYLDFPLGVNPNGFDASHYSAAFAKGVSVGAPPDLFFTKGQNWGFPPFDPDTLRARRYEYFRACIAQHASHAGILRMDHVMGLHRLFWIPKGSDPADGVYVRYPENEMYAILTLESNRHRCAIVGEDLGTVPQYVPAMMKKHGLRRMYVVQYEANPEGEMPFGAPPEQSVASINTHDMPTFAGFWTGRDIEDRIGQKLLDERGAREERQKRDDLRGAVQKYLTAQGLLQNEGAGTREVLEALLRFLAASPAEIVLVNLEDLWLETDPQNVPGVPDRSWRQKFMFTLEQTRRDGNVTAILRSISEQRREVDGDATQETNEGQLSPATTGS